MKVFYQAVALLFGCLIFAGSVFADSGSDRDTAMAACEKEAIDNEVAKEDSDDYVRGCMVDKGFSFSVDGEEAIENSAPSEEANGGERG